MTDEGRPCPVCGAYPLGLQNVGMVAAGDMKRCSEGHFYRAMAMPHSIPALRYGILTAIQDDLDHRLFEAMAKGDAE